MQNYNTERENILRELNAELQQYLLASPGQKCFIKNYELAAEPYDGSPLAELSKLIDANPQIVHQHVENIAKPLSQCIQIFLALSDEKKSQVFTTLLDIITLASEIANKNNHGTERAFAQALNKAKDTLTTKVANDGFIAKLFRKPSDATARLNQLTTKFMSDYRTIAQAIHIPELRVC